MFMYDVHLSYSIAATSDENAVAKKAKDRYRYTYCDIILFIVYCDYPSTLFFYAG